MKYLKLSVISSLSIIFIIFLQSCTQSSSQYLIQDPEIRQGEQTLSLMVIEADDLFQLFPDHLFGALRPMERELFDNQLLSILSLQSRSDVRGRISSDYIREQELTLQEFRVRSGSFSMIAPEIGNEIRYPNSESRFVLILDQFFFTPYQAEVGGDTYAGHENRVEQRIRIEMKYLIWDNELKNAVAWGSIERNSVFDFENQVQTYRELLSGALQQIVQVSPFRG
ncbi:MAG: hypothetical protein EA360_03160 [Balneolaceae bacterium]|nr:MAG: hypothetical protein EA360_03160 [Balneolaceae bacterium]